MTRYLKINAAGTVAGMYLANTLAPMGQERFYAKNGNNRPVK